MNATTNATRDARHGRARSRRLLPLLAVSLVAALAVFVGSGNWSAAPPAAAQTSKTLIANSGQAEAAAGAVLTNDHAQPFTTGGNADGYTLTRVDLEIAHDSTAPAYEVSIHAASGGNPGASLGSLTKGIGSSGTLQFTTAGIDLDAETTYFVLIAGDAGNSGDTVSRTPSKAEDTGGASGWSIADDRRWRSAGSSSAWTTHSTDVLQIAIHGSEQTADNTTPEAAQSTPRSTSNSPVSGTQDTTPTLPSACGADGTDNASIKAVASTSTTITVTFTGLTNPSYAGNLRICEPDSSDVYSARIVNSFAIGSQPAEDDTHDITGLTADTDYWVEYRYSSLNQWHYIRTAVAEPDLPAGCTGAGTDTSLLSAVASTATTVTVTFGSGITIDPGSGSTDVIICEPGTGDAYSTRTAKHFPNNMDPAAGSTFEISGLSAATDYWVRVNFYGGGGPWHYIRTTAASSSDPTITIAAGTSPVTEGTAAEFTVTASPAPTADLTVNLTVADASGSDFVASGDEGSKTVTITANTTTATHSVPTTADTTDEPDGDVTVTVETGTGYTVGATASAMVTVNDDDGPPLLVSNTGQADSFNLTFSEDLAVPFTTGTTNSSGYTLASVAMTFGFGSPGGSVHQGFTVDIRRGSGASVGSSVGSLTSSSLTAGTNTFSSAEGIHLDAGTSYFVVFDLSAPISTRGPHYKSTASDNEDSGAAAGWTIGDQMTTRSVNGGSWKLTGGSNVAEITIRGATAPPQTTPTEGALVANHGQSDAAYANFGNDLAQAFTTGGNTTGYTLTSIEVVGSSTGTAPTYTVAIHEDSSGEPGAKVTNGDLSAPAL
ncbi:MAG: hypothetical protein OXG35_25190, partial [Acidobacteria bacterium]|nr:hypothetical protein [Acidobacteriota bacterium]